LGTLDLKDLKKLGKVVSYNKCHLIMKLYNTTVYYLNDRFHEEIPEDFIFKTWGYRIVDPFGREHTYKDRVMIQHGRKETKWCTIHRQHEVVKAYWDNDQYLYYISRHKKSL